MDAADTFYSGAERISEFGKNYPIGRPAQPAELALAYVMSAAMRQAGQRLLLPEASRSDDMMQ